MLSSPSAQFLEYESLSAVLISQHHRNVEVKVS